MTKITKSLYRAAFQTLWRWAERDPPAYVESIRAYDAILAEFIARSWECGATRGEVAKHCAFYLSAWVAFVLVFTSLLFVFIFLLSLALTVPP